MIFKKWRINRLRVKLAELSSRVGTLEVLYKNKDLHSKHQFSSPDGCTIENLIDYRAQHKAVIQKLKNLGVNIEE